MDGVACGQEGGLGGAFVGDQGVVEVEEEGVDGHWGHGHIGGDWGKMAVSELIVDDRAGWENRELPR